MIKEYPRSKCYDDHGNLFPDETVTVDLRYVAIAEPHGNETAFRVNGSPFRLIVAESYERFVRDWRSAKR